MTSAAETLEKLLAERVSKRSILSFRLSLAVVAATSLLMFDLLWSAIALKDKANSTSLYGLFGVYALIFICSGVLCIYNYRNHQQVKAGKIGFEHVFRGWHKQAYRLLLLLVVLEHCLFFCSLPILVYHSSGLSLSECLFQRSCYGMDYSTWVTVSSLAKIRTQELQTVPVYVYLTNPVMAMFGGYIILLGFGLLQVCGYTYLEKKRVTIEKSSYLFRSRLISGMALTSLTLLVFSIVGLCVIKTNWFVLSLVLSLISVYPLYRLKSSLSKEGKITRLFFRKIAQISISMLFLFLYCSGAGVSTSLIAAVPSYSFSATAQLAVLVCVHVAFSILCAVALYVHLSLTDILWSVELALKMNQPSVVVMDPEEEEQPVDRRASSVLDWGKQPCASCSTQETNTVLVPCGHRVLCQDCSSVLLTIPGFKCPLCCLEVMDVCRA